MSVDQTTLITEKQQSISTVLTTNLLGTFTLQEKWTDIWPQVGARRTPCWWEFISLCLTKIKLLPFRYGPFPARKNFHNLHPVSSHQFLGSISIYILREKQREREITPTSSSFFRTSTTQSFSWEDVCQSTADSHYLQLCSIKSPQRLHYWIPSHWS